MLRRQRDNARSEAKKASSIDSKALDQSATNSPKKRDKEGTYDVDGKEQMETNGK
jgi:hypothetical protein